uniref:uncharacterized protein si:ch73-70k4.1 n=1 Tax=Monopterus albus TaxID=43700 RepID=UPI0009B4E8C1|nr:Fanconi anemia core complex-associated protein 20 [Monopterus albus]
MAESYPKSKLKRKKASVEERKPDISSGGATPTGHSALFSGGITSENVGSVPCATAWWNREQLPAVESLWALTLKSALPLQVDQNWDRVPDLPPPSTVRPTALKLNEQLWCDFSEEVGPFPVTAPPPQKTSSPHSLRLSSSQQDLLALTEPVPDLPDRQLSSHSRQSHDGETTSLQTLTKRPQPSLHSWEETASSTGCTSVGGREGRTGGEQGEPKTGPVNRWLLTNQMKVSDNQVFLQKEGENKEEVDEDNTKEEVQGSFRGAGAAAAAAAGGGGLQSCPMCLLVFPVGFSQMDCDGHLAQCLSEMNVDMTW